jgi:hypothetical protein
MARRHSVAARALALLNELRTLTDKRGTASSNPSPSTGESSELRFCLPTLLRFSTPGRAFHPLVGMANCLSALSPLFLNFWPTPSRAYWSWKASVNGGREGRGHGRVDDHHGTHRLSPIHRS